MPLKFRSVGCFVNHRSDWGSRQPSGGPVADPPLRDEIRGQTARTPSAPGTLSSRTGCRAPVPDGAHRAGGLGSNVLGSPTVEAEFRAHRLERSNGIYSSGRQPFNTSRTPRYRGLLHNKRGHEADSDRRDHAFATAQYGMECEVWQVAASYRTKPRTMMEVSNASRGHRVRPTRSSPRTTPEASASPSPKPSRRRRPTPATPSAAC